MGGTTTVDPNLHAETAAQLEAVRAPGLTIADAAKRFKVETEGLEWALLATDPADPKERFNYEYADRAFAERRESWLKARDDLAFALDAEADDFLRETTQ